MNKNLWLDVLLMCQREGLTRFSITQMAILERFKNYYNEDLGFAFPSKARVAAELSCHVRTVDRNVNKIVDESWIVVRQVRASSDMNMTNEYVLAIPSDIDYEIDKRTLKVTKVFRKANVAANDVVAEVISITENRARYARNPSKRYPGTESRSTGTESRSTGTVPGKSLPNPHYSKKARAQQAQNKRLHEDRARSDEYQAELARREMMQMVQEMKSS